MQSNRNARLLPSALAALAAILLAASTTIAQPEPQRAASTGGRSPHETTSTIIGERRTGSRVTVTYGRPSIKDPRTGETRQVWGGLVPWETPWRLGADEATTLITEQPLRFGETVIPQGVYTLYLVPSENGVSKLAFSRALGKWGTPVDESNDIVRIDAPKEKIAETVERLTIAIVNDVEAGGGILRISWENTRFSLPFTVVK